MNVSKKVSRLLLNDYESPYEVLSGDSGKSTITLTRCRFLYIEAYQTQNNLISGFFKDFFKLRKTSQLVRNPYKMSLDIPRTNQVRFETKNFRKYELKLCKTLPFDIKPSNNLQVFGKLLKNWRGAYYDCTISPK